MDSPWDLLRDCEKFRRNNASHFGCCVISHVLGFSSAYIFPVIGSFGVLSNFLVTYVFLFVFRKPSRQMIYLGCLATADMCTIILFGWIWMFPAKGLPYATRARVYFFIFNTNNITCKIYRFLYSFTSSLSSSLFLLTACDRCLCIYFPLRFARLSKRRAWQAVGVTSIMCFLAMLPFGILTRHGTFQGKIICWVHEHKTFLQIYHVLFANSCLFQTTMVIFVNIALLFQLRRSARLRQSMSRCTSANREIAASMLLVILSAIVVVSALPQSIGYTLSTIFAYVLEKKTARVAVRVAFNISDLGWQILFIQQTSNWIIYMKRMKIFRTINIKFLSGHCQAGRNLFEETFGTLNYFSTRARNFTSNARIYLGRDRSSRNTNKVSEFSRAKLSEMTFENGDLYVCKHSRWEEEGNLKFKDIVSNSVNNLS